MNITQTTIDDSIISNNTTNGQGGGIALYSGSATISRSTISGNSSEWTANGGGGIMVGPYMTASIYNSTISGNTSVDSGGGLDLSQGDLRLINSTVTGNHSNTKGGGIANSYDSTIQLYNTIVAGNTATGSGPDLSGAATSNDYNLIGSLSGASISTKAHDITGVDPNLGPLADNGGPTPTHALLPGSPAIDNGNTDQPIDQRGIARPQDAADDIGAVESENLVTLTIVKKALGGDGTFKFGSTVNSDVLIPAFNLTTQGGTAQQAFSGLSSGFFEIGEEAPAGWELTDIKCDGISDYSTAFPLVEFNAPPGADITCTFTNAQHPTAVTLRDLRAQRVTLLQWLLGLLQR